MVLQMRGGNIMSGRIGLGGVGTKPWRAARAEQLLKGRPSETLYQAVAAAALEDAKPQTYNAFKIQNWHGRTLIRALTTTGGIA